MSFNFMPKVRLNPQTGQLETYDDSNPRDAMMGSGGGGMLEYAAQLGSDPIYGQSNAALSQYYNLADQYEGLPATPEPKKRGFLGKLATALPEIFAGLEYVAKSTSPSTRSQREAGDQLSTRMARISQIRDSRKAREQQELDKEHEKVLTALNIAGKKYDIENRKAQQVEEKNQATKMEIRQSYLDSLHEKDVNSAIANREADNKRADDVHKTQMKAYNAKEELNRKADLIRAYHAKNPDAPYTNDEIAIMKAAYSDWTSPEEQLQNFFGDLTDQVDSELKLLAGGPLWDEMDMAERRASVSKFKGERMEELTTSLVKQYPQIQKMLDEYAAANKVPESVFAGMFGRQQAPPSELQGIMLGLGNQGVGRNNPVNRTAPGRANTSRQLPSDMHDAILDLTLGDPEDYPVGERGRARSNRGYGADPGLIARSILGEYEQLLNRQR